MQGDIAIRAANITKVYRVYSRPEHRLLQMATLGRVRRFAEYAALRGISLDIRRGETVGIVGRNGCGKSTLLQIICGTLQPTFGHVAINGRVAALLELGSGFNPEFTGRENVYMNGAILGLSRAEIDERFARIAEFAAIGDFIERPVKTYSSGMYVRLAFAVATSVDPDILVVDEALAVGDEAFQRKCFARIEAIKRGGGTILFVSHAAQAVIQLCDRAILLDAGEKILEGPPKLVVSQYQRLVNASPDMAPVIRRSIIDSPSLADGEDGDGAAGPAEGPEEPPPLAEAPPAEAPPPAAPAIATDYLEDGLVSQSRVSLESRGATISDVRIATLGGDRVNVVTAGRRYILAYRVDLDQPAQSIGFGMSIRSITGVAIGGLQTFNAERLRYRSPQVGEPLDVRFEFTCCLNRGVYTLDVGVLGAIGDEPVVMHRIQDALLFRVVQDTPGGETGLVDLGIIQETGRAGGGG